MYKEMRLINNVMTGQFVILDQNDLMHNIQQKNDNTNIQNSKVKNMQTTTETLNFIKFLSFLIMKEASQKLETLIRTNTKCGQFL